MAEKSRKNESLREVRQRVERSREELGRDLSGLRYELDFPLKIRRSFQSKTVVWIAAAAAVGLIFAVLPSRRKKIYVEGKRRRKGKETLVEAGVLLSAVKIAANLLKPVIVSYAVQKMKSFGSRPKSKWGTGSV
jgi:hypothetical protein